jgi:micrococcal nuclease
MGKAELLKNTLPRLVLGLLFVVLVFGFFCQRILNNQLNRSSSPPEEGVVIAVFDGDTIKVKFDNNRGSRIVRLIGIDAPEIDQPKEETQFQAHVSKRFTFHYLYRKKVSLTYDRELEDKYGRLLAYVWTEEQRLFNRFILQEGFASAFLRFPFRDDYRQDFEKAEKQARRLEKGFWGGPYYPEVQASEANSFLGKIVSVVFFCARVQPDKNFLFLHSQDDEFAALIPRKHLSSFPDSKKFAHKNVSVTGFLEEYKGQPQIFIFLPNQIKIVAGGSLSKLS